MIVSFFPRPTQRTKTSDQFRAMKQGILFSSDVSARGVDYPGITHVIQLGIPSSREMYIHRLGRTGRAGKDGEGIIVLDPEERFFLKTELKDLPIEPIPDPKPTDKAIMVSRQVSFFNVSTGHSTENGFI